MAKRKEPAHDAGVADKRLLVIESEFSSPVRMLGRDGNILSAVARQAHDTGDLRILTKNEPARSTGAHISIVGHISASELRSELSTNDKANGFGNRIIWACVKRSQCLPEGGQVDPDELDPLVRELSEAVTFAKGVGEIRRAPRPAFRAATSSRSDSSGRRPVRAAPVPRHCCRAGCTDCRGIA